MTVSDASATAPGDAAAAKLAVGDLPQHMDAPPQSALPDDTDDDTDRVNEGDHDE